MTVLVSSWLYFFVDERTTSAVALGVVLGAGYMWLRTEHRRMAAEQSADEWRDEASRLTLLLEEEGRRGKGHRPVQHSLDLQDTSSRIRNAP